MVPRISCRKQCKARECGVFTQRLSGQGQVVSVYSKAINVLHQDGLIASLVQSQAQMSALSIRVPSFFRSSESQGIQLKPGDRSLFEGSRLIINDLCFDLSTGATWEGRLEANDLEGFSLPRLPLFRKALVEEGKRGGLLGLIHREEREDPFVRKASHILDEAWARDEKRSFGKGLSRLVGLGVGFTPSGDDFISGVFLGQTILELLSCSRPKGTRMKRDGTTLRAIESEEIRKVLDKTNHSGRTLLWQVLEGHFPYYLIEAVRGLARAENTSEILKSVGRAASHGETSGTDALVGLFVYLDWVINLCGNTC
ncbi:MAG: DUF2877 domain-containing protein [Proteobacteria bacterium]|nr:DUF2877 domain-containing protein [Pseudomonadota bacterium]NIS72065.1 DUF2877 domain-containing protein [Pseudomonadota bacterium]